MEVEASSACIGMVAIDVDRWWGGWDDGGGGWDDGGGMVTSVINAGGWW